MEYDPEIIERKWRHAWEISDLYQASNQSSSKPPCFIVDMFPYPSGSSMHVGHPRGYVATDIYSRFKRMKGFNVLHPMGWDAFGLPAEETAIQNKEYPAATVSRNISKFKSQLAMLGLGYDWSREINTTDPGYYKHTQRIFLEFLKRGLALSTLAPVNWCPKLGTVLANEDIVDGKSERGGYPVLQKQMRQWVLAITAYADRLVDDLSLLPHWPERVKNAQKRWIGRSEGHSFIFTTNIGISIPVFTTQIETLSGVTFIVVAPDHGEVSNLCAAASNRKEIEDYLEGNRQDISTGRQVKHDKTGVILEGITAHNPVTNAEIPVLVANYVLVSYGTGAIMAVPAHDERDAQFATMFNLPSVTVIKDGRLINAGQMTGMPLSEARNEIATLIGATAQKRYKIRDWVFSRQRFWGEPFPIVWVVGRDNYNKIAQGSVHEWLPPTPVSYREGNKEFFAVPVIPRYLEAMQLPQVDSYEPTGTVEGPLASIDSWVHAFIDPVSGEVRNTPETIEWIPVTRETNTMPQWAGSSWYWLRYMDPHNSVDPFSKESARYWGPVDVYAGADHAVAHLIYARFWHKVLFDAGMVEFSEPFERLEFLGHVLAADGSKISKRKGNSRSPEEVVQEVGADALRLYEMFLGPFEKSVPWDDKGVIGTRRLLDRVWRKSRKILEMNVTVSEPSATSSLYRAVQKIEKDIEAFKFNTAVASLMICMNEIEDFDLTVEDFKIFLAVLAPFAPYITEELWSHMGNKESVHVSVWPSVHIDYDVDENILLTVQVNGKRRAIITVSRADDEVRIQEIALADANVQKYLEGRKPSRIVYVPGRIVSIVL